MSFLSKWFGKSSVVESQPVETAPVEIAAIEPAVQDAPAHGIDQDLVTRIVTALGGKANILSVESCAISRVRIELRNSANIDTAALQAAGIVFSIMAGSNIVHLVVGEQIAERWAQAVQAV